MEKNNKDYTELISEFIHELSLKYRSETGKDSLDVKIIAPERLLWEICVEKERKKWLFSSRWTQIDSLGPFKMYHNCGILRIEKEVK